MNMLLKCLNIKEKPCRRNHDIDSALLNVTFLKQCVNLGIYEPFVELFGKKPLLFKIKKKTTNNI